MWSKVIIWLADHGIKIAIVVIIGYLATVLASRIGKKLIEQAEDEDKLTESEREKRAKTLAYVINITTKAFVYTIVAFIVLKEIGIEIGPLLAGAGVVGLAVGFGAQTLIRDVIAGFFIIMENQYSVGDYVELNGVGGTVQKITMRTTVLRNLEGIVHIIPNGEIKKVSNFTQDYSRVLLDIPAPYNESFERVKDVINDVGKGLATDEYFSHFILEPIKVLGLQEFGPSEIRIRVMGTVKSGHQWNIAREFRRRIKERFDKEGIEIPFQHIVVVRKNDNKGTDTQISR